MQAAIWLFTFVMAHKFKDKNYCNLAALVKNNQPVECNCLEGPCKYLKTTSIQYSVRLLRIAFRLSIGQEKSSHRLRVHCPMSKHAGPGPESKARNPATEGTNLFSIKYSQKTSIIDQYSIFTSIQYQISAPNLWNGTVQQGWLGKLDRSDQLALKLTCDAILIKFVSIFNKDSFFCLTVAIIGNW